MDLQMSSKSMCSSRSSQSKSFESTLLSVEEVEERIQHLIAENTDLRSIPSLFLLVSIVQLLTCNFVK